MNEKDIREISVVDYDIIENLFVALRELWRRKLIIILCTIAGFLCAVIFVSIKGNTVRYYSSATLYSAVYGSVSESNDGVAVMNRYSGLLKSSRVCGRAAKSLAGYNVSTEQLQSMINGNLIQITGANKSSASYGYQLRIDVFNDDYELVIPIANAMANAYAAELNDLLGTNAIQVMDSASRYSYFNTTNATKYYLVITAAAFVAAAGLVFVFGFFSPSVKSIRQCEQDEDYILGMLPYVK